MRVEEQEHPKPGELARYLDRSSGRGERERIERHLATCEACQDDLVAAVRFQEAGSPGAWTRRSWHVLGPLGAVAAAMILFVASPWSEASSSPHRGLGPASSLGVAASVPAPLHPLGPVLHLDQMVWSPVTVADRYRLTLYDVDGTVLWAAETRDTSIVPPGSLQLAPGRPYFWRVEARTAWDRWLESDLAEFTLGRPKAP